MLGHPVLNDNVRQAGLALANAGILQRFHTGLDTTTLARLPLRGATRELERRSLPPELHALTRSHPLGEIARLAVGRIPRRFNPFDGHLGPFSIQARAEAIDRVLAKEVRKDEVTAVYAYEDGAAAAFAAANSSGKRAIYDLPIGYWRAGRALFEEEAELRPEWKQTMVGLRDPGWKLERKDVELELASEIIVASSFTARTLESYRGRLGPVHVVPYGAPEVVPQSVARSGNTLRVLYVGSLTQRKGIADLLEALPLVGARTELTVIGRRVGDSAPLDAALSTLRWIPSMPHSQILHEMAAHDVLVLPSLFEGFGLVLSEALSQGTPIIATDHTAAPDLLAGVEEAGWIVPIRSPQAIATALDRLSDHDLRVHSREQASAAAKLHSWESYRTALVESVLGNQVTIAHDE